MIKFLIFFKIHFKVEADTLIFISDFTNKLDKTFIKMLNKNSLHINQNNYEYHFTKL